MTKAPCEQCPFLRRSRPRGNAEVVHFMLHDLEVHMGCEEREAAPCMGSLIYMSNTCKIPREPEYSALVVATPQNRLLVFSSRQQLIEHHNKETE